MPKERVLFDVNVIIDVIEHREPFVTYSGPALYLAEIAKIEGFISATSIDTIAFLIRKQATPIQINAVLNNLINILQVAQVDHTVIQNAINYKWNDPEDAIIYEAAKASDCNVIVTRNKKDFKKADSNVKILFPEELVKHIQ